MDFINLVEFNMIKDLPNKAEKLKDNMTINGREKFVFNSERDLLEIFKNNKIDYKEKLFLDKSNRLKNHILSTNHTLSCVVFDSMFSIHLGVQF